MATLHDSRSRTFIVDRAGSVRVPSHFVPIGTNGPVREQAQAAAVLPATDSALTRFARCVGKTLGVTVAALLVAIMLVLGVATGGVLLGVAAFAVAIFFVFSAPFLSWGTAPTGSAFRP